MVFLQQGRCLFLGRTSDDRPNININSGWMSNACFAYANAPIKELSKKETPFITFSHAGSCYVLNLDVLGSYLGHLMSNLRLAAILEWSISTTYPRKDPNIYRSGSWSEESLSCPLHGNLVKKKAQGDLGNQAFPPPFHLSLPSRSLLKKIVHCSSCPTNSLRLKERSLLLKRLLNFLE